MKLTRRPGLLALPFLLTLVGYGIRSSSAIETAHISIVRATIENPDTWTRWRGPSGQGQVESDGYVDAWSHTENVLWKVEVPGQGNSSPILLGDRIFLTTAYEGGGKRRSILCFSRSTGEDGVMAGLHEHEVGAT